MSLFQYISNICAIFISGVNIPEKSESLLSKPVKNHNLIMKLLEEGAIHNFVFDKVTEDNRKYIEEIKGEKVRDMV